MSKKKKIYQTVVDFDIGIGEIVPSTQEAFSGGEFSQATRKLEGTAIKIFKENFLQKVEKSLKNSTQFPTSSEIFIFVMQYFLSEKEYKSRDIDNMAKTILDLLKDKFYSDDGQVKTLLVGKKMEKRVPKNFAYIAIKEPKDGRDVDALKISGLERSVTLFQELKGKKIL